MRSIFDDPTWLKGGSLLLIIHLFFSTLAIIIITLTESDILSGSSSGNNIFNVINFPIIYFLPLEIISSLNQINQFIAISIFGAIIAFIIGSVLGLIISVFSEKKF